MQQQSPQLTTQTLFSSLLNNGIILSALARGGEVAYRVHNGLLLKVLRRPSALSSHAVGRGSLLPLLLFDLPLGFLPFLFFFLSPFLLSTLTTRGNAAKRAWARA